MARFRRRGGAVEMRASATEARGLARLVEDLLRMLDADEQARRVDDGQEGEEDPLAALVGMSSAPVSRPTDPALARLFPDAYAGDEDRAAEYRRYTESDLRRGKREAGQRVGEVMERLADDGKVRLAEEEADALMTCLNDLRLVLGTRLDIDEDWPAQAARLRRDDPRRDAFAVYETLTALQDALVTALLD